MVNKKEFKDANVAVVLLNLGAPEKLESVRPFLFNLFNDPAIIRIPNPFRWLLAKFISTLRYKKAQGIYSEIGGKSPLLENTEMQADALVNKLKGVLNNVQIHICMRYWHPMVEEVIEGLQKQNPDHIVLLPLYPQFSTTTTGSSVKQMREFIQKANLGAEIHEVCCYPTNEKFVLSHVETIKSALSKHQQKQRILFSAHGVPQDIIDDGDPYEWQISQTVAAIMKHLPDEDHQICYQSKVGPKKWLEPSLDQAMEKAKQDDIGVVVVPIAFVSEHSETLVELDMEYKENADEMGIKSYTRVAAIGAHDHYIESLKALTMGILEKPMDRVCPQEFCACKTPKISAMN